MSKSKNKADTKETKEQKSQFSDITFTAGTGNLNNAIILDAIVELTNLEKKAVHPKQIAKYLNEVKQLNTDEVTVRKRLQNIRSVSKSDLVDGLYEQKIGSILLRYGIQSNLQYAGKKVDDE